MKIVTAAQMRELEQRTVEAGISVDTLMENAGLAVAQEVRRWLGQVGETSVLVLVGPGNNGGDGLVAARHLHDWGAKVHLYITSYRNASDKNYRLVMERGADIVHTVWDQNLSILDSLLSSVDIAIDAIFGTGKTRPVQGVFRDVLSRLKSAKAERPQLKMVALDLPSGLDPDTGAIDPALVPADLTITLGYPKVGHFCFPGAGVIGKLVTVDIGIPSDLAENLPVELTAAEWVRNRLPARPAWAHKGTFGKVMVVAGSINYVGAAYLAGAGATRAGAGLVTLACASTIYPVLAGKLTEVTFLPLPESEPGFISAKAWEILKENILDYDVLLFGCGIGQKPGVLQFTEALLSSSKQLPERIVIDADGLNSLSRVPRWWDLLPQEAIITPHPGEMARLTGSTIEDVQGQRMNTALRAAADWNKIVVLKGAYAIVAAPDGRAKINPMANPGLATAGTGDVLAGAVAGLLAQGLRPFEAATAGVYLHGAAGERVKDEVGDAGMVAGDLLPILPKVIKNLKEL